MQMASKSSSGLEGLAGCALSFLYRVVEPKIRYEESENDSEKEKKDGVAFHRTRPETQERGQANLAREKCRHGPVSDIGQQQSPDQIGAEFTRK